MPPAPDRPPVDSTTTASGVQALPTAPDAARVRDAATARRTVEVDEEPWGRLTTARDGRVIAANQRFIDWSGHASDRLAAIRFEDLLTPASRVVHETHYLPLLAVQGFVSELAFELVHLDGGQRPVLVCAVVDDGEDAADGMGVVSLTVFDATEGRRQERALQRATRAAELVVGDPALSNRDLLAQHEALRVTLRSIADAVVTLDASGAVTSMNPAAEALTTVREADAIGSSSRVLGTLLDATSRMVVEPDAGDWGRLSDSANLLLRRPDGGERFVAIKAAPIRDEDGLVRGLVLVCRDVTGERAAMRQLEFDASHDHLTGLYNRRAFERRVADAPLVASPDTANVLCYLDLDQFKVVNDTAGHSAGDQLLIQVSALLREGLRPSDTLARLGGDEFGVLLEQSSFEAGLAIADELRQRVAAYRFDWCGHAYAITASIGVSVLDADGARIGDALNDADMACNAAKEGGRNQVYGVKPDDARVLSRRDEMGWIARIRRALDEDRFELQYQPIVALRDGASGIAHVEVLLRLRDDDGTLLAPGAFITAAERYSQMQPIDRWVLRKAFEWLATVDDVQASINVSGQSFGDPAFLVYAVELFRTSGIRAGRVCFEITETAAIADLDAAMAFITTLRTLGACFSLDDFGAGMSSYRYLKTLPVDFIKIDGSFVSTAAVDPVNRAIVESIHRIARLCHLQTVAEWVEDEATLQVMRSIGIDHAQGWHFGRPMPVADVAAWLAQRTTDASGNVGYARATSPRRSRRSAT